MPKNLTNTSLFLRQKYWFCSLLLLSLYLCSVTHAQAIRICPEPFADKPELSISNSNEPQAQFIDDCEVQFQKPTTPYFISTPSIDTDGNYTVEWGMAGNYPSRYELQEYQTSWQNIYSGTSLSLTISNRSEGVYKYRVRACNNFGCSSYTSATSVSVGNIPLPSVPSSINAPGDSYTGSFKVTWGSSSGRVTSYRLYEKSASSGWVNVYTGVSLYNWRTGKNNGDYQYSVAACNESGCSNKRYLSHSVTVLNPPSTPTNISVPTGIDYDGSFEVTWAQSSGEVYRYELQQRKDGGNWSSLFSGTARLASTTITENGRYSFQVRACNEICSTYKLSSEVQVNLDGGIGNSDYDYFDWFLLDSIQFLREDDQISPPIGSPFLHSSNLPESIRKDYLPANGWELVYNQFSTTDYYEDKFFAIYNKYRGILRFFYLYDVPKGGVRPNQWTWGIAVEGAANQPTSLLNQHFEFARAENDRTTFPSYTRSNDMFFNISAPASYSWSFFDIEVGYDQTIINQHASNLSWKFFAIGMESSDIELNGDLKGTLTSDDAFSMTGSGGNQSFLNIGSLSLSKSNDINQSTNTTISTNVGNNSGKTSWFSKLSSKINNQVEDQVSGQISKLAGSVVSDVIGFISQPLGSVFKSILGVDDSATQPPLTFQMDTKIHLSGTIDFANLQISSPLTIPGLNHSDNDGLNIPLYDKPLGVFNLKTTPIIDYTEYPIYLDGDFHSFATIYGKYYLRPNSVELIINDAIKNDIEINNISTDLLYYGAYTGPSNIAWNNHQACSALERDGHDLLSNEVVYTDKGANESDPADDVKVYETLYHGGATSLKMNWFGVYLRNTNVYPQDPQCIINNIITRVTVKYSVKDTGQQLIWSQQYLSDLHY